MAEQIKDIESALKKVKDQKENYGFMDRFTVDENWEVTKALEKQIPKKPLDFGDEAYLCPCCKRNNFYKGICLYKEKYCDYCGQKIDWSDEE